MFEHSGEKHCFLGGGGGGGGINFCMQLFSSLYGSHLAFCGSLWSRFQTMLDSQIDFTFEVSFHFYASRAVSCPRRAMANWTAELKRLVFFCFDVLFESKTFISGGRF